MVSGTGRATIEAMPSLRSPLRAVAVIALVALAACSPSGSPSPTASGTPGSSGPAATPGPAGSGGPAPTTDAATDAVYRDIEEAIVGLRGLEPREEVDPQLLTEAELKERIATSFTEDNPPELVEANEVLYRALGMLEEDASLTDLYVELLGSQVAGFYEPDSDELYVVARSGELGVSERVTYAHEFTHALQDQHFDLESFGLDQIGFGDRNAARLALIEGDATAAMYFWAQTALTPEQAIELLDTSQDPEAQAILARMPPILRESLTFPYQEGLKLVLRLQAGGGGWDAVNEAYADPPASTEQLLHLEKYEDREAPLEVDLPAELAAQMGGGWEATYEDTFGEFQLQVWLRNALDAATGNAAAAGWGGDRFVVLEGLNDRWAVVMRTAWDDAAEATEFQEAAGTVIGDGRHAGTVIADGSDVTLVVASDGTVLNEVVSAAGFVISG